MKGDINLINNVVTDSKKCLIKDDIGKHSPLHIVSVINDEFFKEFKRKLETSHSSTISLDYLGNFTVKMSPLKKYIRNLISSLRKTKVTLAIHMAKPDFNKDTDAVYKYYNDLTIKFKAANSQLNEQRKIFILRYLLYTNKKRLKNPDFKPNIDYTWFPYSFKEEMLNNDTVVLKNIQPKD